MSLPLLACVAQLAAAFTLDHGSSYVQRKDLKLSHCHP